jgi:hypothetical protein
LCFRYLPLWQRYHRLRLFRDTDKIASIYGPSARQVQQRKAAEEDAKHYIYTVCPQKYHDFVVPDFPLGCKRRIFDPGYLASLHKDHIELLPEGIAEIMETGIISESGKREDFDVIVLATGFKVQDFLAPMEIIGRDGVELHAQWAAGKGAQAYMASYVHNFPNMGVLFGPNSFPAFNSVIFAVEVQVAYIAKTLVAPLLDGYADVIEVREEAEEKFVRVLDETLATTVFAAGCSNWYINSAGRNSASWPGLAQTFWLTSLWPDWSAYETRGGDSAWVFRRMLRWVKTASVWTWIGALSLATAALLLTGRTRFGSFNVLDI